MKRKNRPRISKARLEEMIEEATVDANGESEQITGWFTMISQGLTVPFETVVLGVTLSVERIDLNRSEQIVAICSRGRKRKSLAILDLPLPTPAPEGAECIEAYRQWLVQAPASSIRAEGNRGCQGYLVVGRDGLVVASCRAPE